MLKNVVLCVIYHLMEASNIDIKFLGGAGTVTGSKFLVKALGHQIMIDCGMFQGLKELRLLNWEPLPIDIDQVDLVLLTHGHLDHSSYLPKLVQQGFKGRVLGTSPTLALTEIVISDSAKIMEEEAQQANREGYSKHPIAKPLYTSKDVQQTLPLMRVVNEGEWIDLFEGISVRFQYNGHIIGSCFIELELQSKRLVFSGDLGRKSDFLLNPYKKPLKADYLFMETTYGDRLHPQGAPYKEFKREVLGHFSKGGKVLLLPSFAIERTQLMMYLLWKLKEEGALPNIDLVMDSPMATKVLEVFKTHNSYHHISEPDLYSFIDAFEIVEDYAQTWEVIDSASKKIVVAGSGMLTGGRMLTYLQAFGSKKSTTIMLTGYQAEGTRGRDLLEGIDSIKIRGKYYEVRAQIKNLSQFSGHGDQSELFDWLSELESPPQKCFLIHGEPSSSKAFKELLESKKQWSSIAIPSLNEDVQLN